VGFALSRLNHSRVTSASSGIWLDGNRVADETSILQDYGPSWFMAMLNGVSVAPVRYEHLVQALGMPS
jgi:hypothetical protein